MGPSPHLCFFSSCKTATLRPEVQVSMGPRPHQWFFAFKTATLAPQLQVSMGPSPHLWFLHAKQRLLDQNYKSLWVPALICGFFMQNCDFSVRITSLYGSQTSPFFTFKTATLAPELQVSICPSPHLLVCAFTTATLWPELIVSMGPSPHLSFCACKTS